MGKVVGAARTVAMLIAVWAVLLGVGWVAGAIPQKTLSSGPRDATEAGDNARARKGTVGDGDAAARRATGTADGSVPTGQPISVATRIARYPICPASIPEPELVLLDVVGNPDRELAVGCGPTIHLLALSKQDGALSALVRIAAFDVSEAPAGGATHAAVPRAGDIDGDRVPDLVLGFWYLGPDGAPRGGELFLARRNETGAFDVPRRLGSFGASNVVIDNLDGVAGSDVIASNRMGNAVRRTGEVWLFTGGASPVRSAVHRIAADIVGLAVSDLDGDQKNDVVVASAAAPGITVLTGDGGGRFGRVLTLELPDARAVVTGNLDVQEAPEVVVQGRGLHLVRGRADGALEAVPIDAPLELTSIQVVDANADSRGDIVGMIGSRVVALTQVEPMAFREEELVSFEAGTFTAKRVVVGDMDANGKPELIVLGRPSASALNWELLVISDSQRGTIRAMDTAPKPVLDAPLQLTIALR